MSFINSCRRVRASDFREQWLLDRAAELHEPVNLHRKLWEYAVIAQVYKERIDNGGLVLGFGVGKEPLASWFAAQSANVTATDLPGSNPDWDNTNQHATRKQDLYKDSIINQSDFDRLVSFRPVDMNSIPADLLKGQFDMTYSCGSFEHIGGLKAGIDFFCNQMQCLKPGGIAVHTTEYNYDSNDDTINADNLCLYRHRDLISLRDCLAYQDDKLWTLDLSIPHPEDPDLYIDEPPYRAYPYHLNIRIGNHVTTSIVLIAQRGGN